MLTIDILPDYELISARTDWLTKEFNFVVRLTPEQYSIIKSSCSLELLNCKISITDKGYTVTAYCSNKLAKLIKLTVHDKRYTGEFVVGFTHLSYQENNNYHGREREENGTCDQDQ
jgi:hypothetical protein